MLPLRRPTTVSRGTAQRAADDEVASGVVPSSKAGATRYGEFPPRFLVKGLLGQGGMGAVYKAYDAELATDIALKTINRVTPHDLYHLKREFRALADIRHPNLINFYELFAEGRNCFFTMELIVGTDLLGHLRAGAAEFEEPRFRDVARQLALAVSAVHGAKRLHRDIKPSNVMVTRAGRLVLLDFGLVLAISPESGRSERATFAGTGAYMAPEQLRGELELTAAADWYCTGVTLYEAASGRLPFSSPIRALTSQGPPPPLREQLPDFPEDIDQLLGDLLHPMATRRPSGSEVLHRLGMADAPLAASGRPTPLPAAPSPFEGRVAEMEILHESLRAVAAGAGAVVRLHGPSGIGKSELARRFVGEAARWGATVLEARCHPQETVLFNALDGAIDDLSRVLEAMPRQDVEGLVPQHVDALVRIFPVLGRVSAIAEASGADRSSGAEALRMGTRAFKQLLGSLSRRHTLVLWIDDAQWADAASGSMLEELVASRDAPAMLLLLTHRSDEGGAILDRIARAVPKGGLATADLPLGRLSERDSRALMASLLGKNEADATPQMMELASEAEGSPFFIRELARYVSATGDRQASVYSRVQLTGLLQARVSALSPTAKAILEVVSVAGGPLEQQLLVRARGAADGVRLTLQTLERECLVRSVVLGDDRRTEVYHHRIREQVLDGLSEGELRARHRSIADALLTAERPHLVRVVEHYDAAGDSASVRRYVVAAARHAAASLAFDLAAKLYRRAIDIGGTEVDESELRARLADALASAGRDRRAGEEFERAASLAESKDDLRTRAPYLRQRAAMQYLKSGHREDAQRSLAAVLAPLGLTLPKTRNTALLRMIWLRGRLLARGLDFERRDLTQIPRGALDRVDLLQVLGMSLALIDHTRSHWLGTATLLEALEAGEASRVRTALARECVTWAAVPGVLIERQVDRMFELLKKLNIGVDDPLHLGGEHCARGLIAWFRGCPLEAVEQLAQARALFQTVREGATFHITNCEAFRLPALAQLGRIRELIRELESDLRDAEDRGDELFVASCAAGQPCLAWLAQDRPDVALHWADRVLRSAPPDFSSQHYFHLVSNAQARLYEGRPLEASRMVEEAWPKLKTNLFLTLSWVRDELADLRARAAVAAAVAIRRGAKHLSRSLDSNALLAIAEREAKNIERHALPSGGPLAATVHASIAALQGQSDRAIALLRGAATQFGALQMDLHRHVAMYAVGTASGYAADRTRMAESETWMRQQGIVRPEKIAAMMAPGFSFSSWAAG